MNEVIGRICIVVGACGATMLTSGLVVHGILHLVPDDCDESDELAKERNLTLGTIIGKCENILAVCFILAGEFTGLGLIFAAKSVLRAKDAARDPKYYVAGSLVNFTYSVVVGLAARGLMGLP